MYEHFLSSMGLRENPFHVSPDPQFYCSTPAHESALAELRFGIETRQGLLVLTGEAGTGKTFLLNQILEWLLERGLSSAYVFHTHLEPVGLFRFVLSDFGVQFESKYKSELVKRLHVWLLQRHAVGDIPVLILDEAQALPSQTLDELRLLLNLETPRGKLLQIILSGQPELDEKLRQPDLRQLRQRIVFHSRLSVLSPTETAAYISSRLATAGCSDSSLFPANVVQEIHTSSRGIPRVINLLCEHALLSALAEQERTVSREMIHRISMDFDLLGSPQSVVDLELQPNRVRFAPFPAIEKLVPSFAAVQPLIREKPIPAVLAGLPAESSVPVVPLADVPTSGALGAILSSSPRHRSRWAGFGRNFSATVRRAWHGLTPLLVDYARSVSNSFMRDFHASRRLLTLPSRAPELGSSGKKANAKTLARRNVAPLVNWLRQPVPPGTLFGNHSGARSVRRR